MKTKKLIRYRIPVSVKFPAMHPRKGEETNFVDKILANRVCDKCLLKSELCDVNCSYSYLDPKIHTIRANYALWQKRFEKIDKGEAVLELYTWSGKPYNSKAVTICQLGKDDGIGLQRIKFENGNIQIPYIPNRGSQPGFGNIALEELAKNDGLSLDDFKAWFKGADLSEPMAIIHFTPFRY